MNQHFVQHGQVPNFQLKQKIFPQYLFHTIPSQKLSHISASGENIRIKFTNKYGTLNFQILEANIADSISQGSGEIDLKTLTPITFK